jgi:hypothetical protein
MNFDDDCESDEFLNWEQICEIEPRIKVLFEEAEAIRDDAEEDVFCAASLS